MTRKTAREIAMHLTFELAFSNLKADQLLERELTEEAFAARGQEEELYAQFPGEGLKEYIVTLVRGVADHGAELDGYIERHAKGWRFSRIDRVAAAIMRLTMYEILYMPDVPNKVAINEAVELAKKFSGGDSPSFVNGVLGKLAKLES